MIVSGVRTEDFSNLQLIEYSTKSLCMTLPKAAPALGLSRTIMVQERTSKASKDLVYFYICFIK